MTRSAPVLKILVHPGDRFWNQRSLVHLLVSRWRADGWRVSTVTDPRHVQDADLGLLHVSPSVVPERLRPLPPPPRVLNGAVLDIRKRRLSRFLVDRDGPDPGPVIVKTDWNAGGWRELREAFAGSPWGGWVYALDPRGGLWRRLAPKIEGLRSWNRRRILSRYRIYPSRSAVPAGVWDNPHLLVQRFLPEREGRRYVCRHWLFLGSREVTRRTMGDEPIVKLGAGMTRTQDSVPDELRRMRSELGFDYGKFDYGVVDGEVVLYDANRTPGAACDARVHDATIDVLAPGLRDYLP